MSGTNGDESSAYIIRWNDPDSDRSEQRDRDVNRVLTTGVGGMTSEPVYARNSYPAVAIRRGLGRDPTPNDVVDEQRFALSL